MRLAVSDLFFCEELQCSPERKSMVAAAAEEAAAPLRDQLSQLLSEARGESQEIILKSTADGKTCCTVRYHTGNMEKHCAPFIYHLCWMFTWMPTAKKQTDTGSFRQGERAAGALCTRSPCLRGSRLWKKLPD